MGINVLFFSRRKYNPPCKVSLLDGTQNICSAWSPAGEDEAAAARVSFGPAVRFLSLQLIRGDVIKLAGTSRC